MNGNDDAVFTQLQVDVQDLVLSSGMLDVAEELINEHADLTEDQRAALWLWGWSLLPQQRQQETALRYMQDLESDRWSF